MVNRVKRLLKLKKLFINFSFRSAANLFSKLLGIITLPIITRALGPKAFGDYNLVLIVVQYTALPMAILGLRSYGIREIAAKRKDNSYAAEILSMQILVTIVAIIISLLISFIIFKSNYLLLIAIIIGYIIVFARAFDLEFFYISQKDLVFPTIAKMAGQLIYVFGVVLFIKKPNDFVLLVFLASLSPTIGDIIQLKKYRSKYSKVLLKLSFEDVMNTFNKTWQLGVSQNLEGFLSTIPQLFLVSIVGTYALGIFSGGFKMYGILLLFYVTFFYTLAPYLVQLNDLPVKTKQKYYLFIFTITFSLNCIIGLLLYFYGAPIILLLLGKSFGESTIVFKAISLTLIPLTPVIMLLGNILIYAGQEKYYLIGLIFNGVAILISSPILIKYFGIVGAVYALAFSMFIGIIVLTYFYFTKMFNTENQNIFTKNL